ncbi:UPF0389 protein CG9231-like isoform X1 [Limulus polyphemus]|uniref:UPF0389 protein CG9231-like isoform X1 n=2 Tax=Limulus polyphemus TaxID=6850 RepID=A0ABM1B9R7_LIMPO|nr:UPF0389 protein CG9231-like isoform X1 [Limulus polyphemus]
MNSVRYTTSHTLKMLGVRKLAVSCMFLRHQNQIFFKHFQARNIWRTSVCKAEKGLNYHRPNGFEKRLLVWYKKYPSVVEVPDFVPQSTMERIRNVARIRINIFLCFVTALACIGMIYSGKKAAERGESFAQMSRDFHKKSAENSKP